MSPWLVYLFSILDSISCFLTLISVFSFLASLIFFIVSHVEDPDAINNGDRYVDDFTNIKNHRSLSYKFCALLLASGILAVLTPSKQDAMLIYALPKIANNKQIQDLPPKLLQSINDTIDGYDQYIKRKLGDKGDKK